MFRNPRFLALLAVLCLLAVSPTPVHGQAAFPPGLELQTPPQVLAPDAGAPVCPPVAEPVPVSPWYADAEFAVLFNTAVHFNETFVSVEENNPVFVSPRVYLGRQLAGGGALRFTYRNLTEVGQLGGAPDSFGDWSSKRTFTANWFDFDYVSREYAPFNRLRVRVDLGGRFAFRHTGFKEASSYARSEFTENYYGGGPHLALTSNLLLGRSGWAVYGRVDTAVTFGGTTVTSRYESLVPHPDGWEPVRSNDRATYGEWQFDLSAQVGLMRRWEWRGRTVGFGAGFQVDVLTAGPLEGEFRSFGLVNVGPFLRCEIGF